MTANPPKLPEPILQDDINVMRGMVKWFDPGVLMKILKPVVVSGIFGEYADRRLIQAALDPATDKELYERADIRKTLVPDHTGDVWFDYIADTGDGFDSTYTIAWLQAQEQLKLAEEVTRRGQLLLLGGDLVYPDASRENYENRFRKVFAWAFPDDGRPDEDHPHLYAIPGNHDWYDGLDLFTAYFCGKNPWKIGNWRAQQRRSYFALRISDDLWIWGIDIQLSERVDQPQAQYFRAIAAQMPRGSSIVICTSVPGWYEPEGNSFSSLGYIGRLAREAKRDLRIPLVLSGDVHHYCRYEAEKDGTQFLTAGGGGAFLHGTHMLRRRIGAYWGGISQWIFLANAKSKDGGAKPACYPSMETSVNLLLGLHKFPVQNWKFAGLLGLLYAFAGITSLMWSELSSLCNVATNPIWWLWALVLVMIFIGYADNADWVRNGERMIEKPKTEPEKSKAWRVYQHRRKLLGGLHGLLQIGGMTIVSALLYEAYTGRFAISFWTWAFNLSFGVFAVIFGGFVGAAVFAGYLYATCRWLGVSANDALSAQSLDTCRNFLRFRYKNGQLTVFPIGVDRALSREQWSPSNSSNSSSRVAPSAAACSSANIWD